MTAKIVDQTNEIECQSPFQLRKKKKKRWLNGFIYAVIRLAQKPSYEAFQEELGARGRVYKKKGELKAKASAA